jgi:hypothetical protein
MKIQIIANITGEPRLLEAHCFKRGDKWEIPQDCYDIGSATGGKGTGNIYNTSNWTKQFYKALSDAVKYGAVA